MPRKRYRQIGPNVGVDLGAFFKAIGNTGNVNLQPSPEMAAQNAGAAASQAAGALGGIGGTAAGVANRGAVSSLPPSFVAKAPGMFNTRGQAIADEYNARNLLRPQERSDILWKANLEKQNAVELAFINNTINVLGRLGIMPSEANINSFRDMVNEVGYPVALKKLEAEGAEALARQSEAKYKTDVSEENRDELLRTRSRRQNITDLELGNAIERLPVEGVRDVLKFENEATKFGDETVARSAITPGEVADRARLEFDADMTRGLLLPQTLEAEAAKANEISLSPGQAIVGRREGYRPLATSSFKPITPKSSSYGDQVTGRILGEDTGVGATTGPIISPSIDSFEIKESSLGTIIKNRMTGKSYLLPK